MPRILFDSVSYDQLSGEIQKAEAIFAFDVASNEQRWEWHRYDAETRDATRPIKPVEPLEIAVTTEQLEELKSLVKEVKKEKRISIVESECPECQKVTPHRTFGNQFDTDGKEYQTLDCRCCSRFVKVYKGDDAFQENLEASEIDDD